MPEVISDRDAERIITGETPELGDLADLALLKDTLRREFVTTPTDEAVDVFAAAAADISRTPPLAGEGRQPETTTPVRTERKKHRFRAVTGLAAAVMFAAFSGVALAADGAVPGDPLYRFDRAVEDLGIGAGAAEERIAEAHALFEDGSAAEALEHVVEAAAEATEDGDEEAADALLDAALRLRTVEQGSDHATVVRHRVGDMLEWMAGADTGSPDFGQQVAAFARGISRGSDPVDGPGLSEEAGDSAADPASNAANRAQGGPPS